MTPAATRRMARARILAQSTLNLFNRGQRGRKLEHHITGHGPADVWQDAEGHHCRCYGLQSAPSSSRTAAITAWAAKTLQQTDERKTA